MPGYRIKRKIIITLALLCAAAGLYGCGSNDAGSEEAAYVDSVADYMGIGGSAGMINRFAGVVESQKTWSVERSTEYQIEEVFVEVGQEVNEGDPLFRYDIEQLESQLTQAGIDLERLQNELTSMETTKAQLEKDAEKAADSEKANYTIQIQAQDLSIKQKQIDIQSKQMDIDKLNKDIGNATVTCGLTGIVKSVNTGGTSNENGDNAFITVMQVGDLRIKGSVNEQNIYDIHVGDRVIIHSRVDEELVWKGIIDSIDTENASSNRNSYGGDTSMQSSSYPFYAVPDDSTGLMLGQHVYLEIDNGQDDEDKDGLFLYGFLIDMSDPAQPFVWKEEDGKLVKQSIVTGEHDEEMDRYEVVEGLSAEDRIALPQEGLHEGMATLDMAEMSIDEGAKSGTGEVDGLAGDEISLSGAGEAGNEPGEMPQESGAAEDGI